MRNVFSRIGGAIRSAYNRMTGRSASSASRSGMSTSGS